MQSIHNHGVELFGDGAKLNMSELQKGEGLHHSQSAAL